ncbi:hypothetical protein [Sagittula sp. SSi028]|uniref:hypothetical protein n=1 Tax=Sagittula sp. SSi028 TaxID=3400636 RepID=UPI003AF432B4
MIHRWNRALLEGASGVFERGGKKALERDEEQMKELHAKGRDSDGLGAHAPKLCTISRDTVLWRLSNDLAPTQ